MVMDYERGKSPARLAPARTRNPHEETLLTPHRAAAPRHREGPRRGVPASRHQTGQRLHPRRRLPVLIDFGSHARRASASPGPRPRWSRRVTRPSSSTVRVRTQGPYTDIYAMGGVLVYAMTGTQPAGRHHTHEERPPRVTSSRRRRSHYSPRAIDAVRARDGGRREAHARRRSPTGAPRCWARSPRPTSRFTQPLGEATTQRVSTTDAAAAMRGRTATAANPETQDIVETCSRKRGQLSTRRSRQKFQRVPHRDVHGPEGLDRHRRDSAGDIAVRAMLRSYHDLVTDVGDAPMAARW